MLKLVEARQRLIHFVLRNSLVGIQCESHIASVYTIARFDKNLGNLPIHLEFEYNRLLCFQSAYIVRAVLQRLGL